MIVYATETDLTSADPPWVADPPASTDVLLRWASIAVADACQRDLYVDAPSPDAAAVLRDATCAQVAAWVALGVDPAKSGTDFPAPVKRSTILDATVERDTSSQTKAVQDAADGLCDLARAILQSGGLLYVPGPVFDAIALPSWGLDVPRVCGALSAEGDWPFWP